MSRRPQEAVAGEALDFGANRAHLLTSYALRVLGLLVFAPLFALLVAFFHPGLPLEAGTLLAIGITGWPAWGSIAAMAADVLAVLALHELIHAAVFYASAGAPPKIGIKGPVIFAAAPGFYLRRMPMVINGLAPFAVISVVGVVLLAVVPASMVSWVYIPVVVNASAAGGDFQAIWWLFRQPTEALFEDDGVRLQAWVPRTLPLL